MDPEADRNHGEKRKNRSRRPIRKMETLTLIMTIYSVLKEIAESWIRAPNGVRTGQGKMSNPEPKKEEKPDRTREIQKNKAPKKGTQAQTTQRSR